MCLDRFAIKRTGQNVIKHCLVLLLATVSPLAAASESAVGCPTDEMNKRLGIHKNRPENRGTYISGKQSHVGAVRRERIPSQI